MRIAIVGYGIAGAAAALFLSRAKFDVTVFEAQSDAAGGAGLLLQPPAILLLHQAGLADALASISSPIDQISLQFNQSKSSLILDYNSIHSMAARGIRRAALVKMLRAAAPEVACHFALTIEQCWTSDSKTWLRSTRGEFGPFDLVIGADGVHSAMRALCTNLQAHLRPYASAALVCVAKLSMSNAHVLQQVFSQRSHVSYWPVGCDEFGVASTAIAVPLASDVITMSQEQWLVHLQEIAPALAEKVLALTSLPTLLPYRYRDVIVNRYYDGGVVLVGDAAHAMSPQLGMGASAGLLDVWTLSQCLQAYPVAIALEKYDQIRRPENVALRRMSRLTTPLFQSPLPLIAALRKPILRVLFGSTRLKRHMLKTLTRMPSAMFEERKSNVMLEGQDH
jgi:2-polyprenyl-6-methoxyphenol hydroxylase-like FAD-dependent oxidoreductase